MVQQRDGKPRELDPQMTKLFDLQMTKLFGRKKRLTDYANCAG